MQTHDDKDAQTFRKSFLDKLEARAKEMKGLSEITAGKENEPILAKWKAHGISVVVRPDDPQGILRISVGGGDRIPVPLNYCTIRGNTGECIRLLERTLRALKNEPK